MVVERLGDSERTIGSKAALHLLDLLRDNPDMKAIVIKEVRDTMGVVR